MGVKKLFDTDKLKEKLKKENGKNHIPKLIILIIIGVIIALANNVFNDPESQGVNSNIVNNNSNLNKDISNKELDDGSKSNKDNEMANQEKKIEEKLKDTLEDIDGVGKVKVMVYFKGGEEEIPAININDSTSLTEEKDTNGGTRKVTQKNDGKTIVMKNTQNGTTEPFVVKKNKPQVSGVCVVAEGARDKLIKLQIHKAVVNLFDLKEKDVNVYSMKK